jgi:predicted nuclease of predicted toxin-antitoxin system
MLVSKDADFRQLSFLYGFPPKVVWIRLGNCSTADVERLLRSKAERIREFVADPEAAILGLA